MDTQTITKYIERWILFKAFNVFCHPIIRDTRCMNKFADFSACLVWSFLSSIHQNIIKIMSLKTIPTLWRVQSTPIHCIKVD